MRRSNARMILRTCQGESALDSEEGHRIPRGDETPQPARREHRHDDRHGTDEDQVQAAIVGQGLAKREEEDGAKNRSFDAAEAADDDDEDDLRGPVDAEGGVRLDA